MDQARLFLLIALALLSMLIWQAWQREYHPTDQAAPETTAAEKSAAPPVGVPSAPPKPPVAQQGQPGLPKAGIEQGGRIEVITDVYRAVLDTHGGGIRKLYLLKYPIILGRPEEPLHLLTDSNDEVYIAQSGLIGHGHRLPNHHARFQAEKIRYQLSAGADTLQVPLHWRSPDGVSYRKTYVFHRDSYLIDIEFAVHNASGEPWQGYFYGQLERTFIDTSGLLRMPTYTGAAIYTPEEKFEKVKFEDMAERKLERDTQNGWAAMLQHYFVGAWLPQPEEAIRLYSDVRDNQHYIIGYKQINPTEISSGASGIIKSQLYLGPKEHRRLEKLPPGMELTVDFGWLTVIAEPLFWLMKKIYAFVGNWGWAIIILTLLIKLAFYPLSAASYKSMAKMKKVTPRMQALKERFGDDKQKFQQEMMRLYKTEKINPLGGCLPILIQIPVFIALYWVLLESVEMRQAPFMLWLKDLSAPDPFYVLPLIMGLSMWLQMRLNPTPMDPMQKKIFTIMPIVFTVFFLFFPAGLVLYWVVNNVLSILQQWYINRTIGAKTL